MSDENPQEAHGADAVQAKRGRVNPAAENAEPKVRKLPNIYRNPFLVQSIVGELDIMLEEWGKELTVSPNNKRLKARINLFKGFTRELEANAEAKLAGRLDEEE